MLAAAVQLQSAADPEANRAGAAAGIRAASAAGAELVVLPEKWTVLGSDEQTLAAAESIDGPSMTLCSSLAAELQIDLVAGSFAERREGHDRLSNTCVHFGPDGLRRATFRKIHMFDVDVNGRSYRESTIFEPGDGPVLTTLADGTVAGLAICFDIRFPQMFTSMASAGAEVLCITAAFTKETTEAHWQPVLRSRAIETGCHVVAANQCGLDGANLPTGGRSMIIAPFGNVLCELGTDDPGVATAPLDRQLREHVRMAMPLTKLERPEAAVLPRLGDA